MAGSPFRNDDDELLAILSNEITKNPSIVLHFLKAAKSEHVSRG